jgi:hypothetical protein
LKWTISSDNDSRIINFRNENLERQDIAWLGSCFYVIASKKNWERLWIERIFLRTIQENQVNWEFCQIMLCVKISNKYLILLVTKTVLRSLKLSGIIWLSQYKHSRKFNWGWRSFFYVLISIMNVLYWWIFTLEIRFSFLSRVQELFVG